MGRRPQPNRRRGLLRAAAAVVGLIILLIIIVTVVSSLTAPTVKAPTVPPTAGPVSRTPVLPTPASRSATPLTRTPAARVTAKPVPSGTATRKHKHVALGITTFEDRSGNVTFASIARPGAVEVSPAVQPEGRGVAYFTRAGGAYQRVPLVVRYGSLERHAGYGDRLVRPVWSPDGSHLLYVRVTQTSGIPGARWTLMRWDRRDNRSQGVISVAALALTPLGWAHGRPLYSVAQPTTTDVYTAAAGRSHLLGTVLAQPLVDMALSPNGRYLAFGAPDNCGHCTLDIFDLAHRTVWVGPTGMSSAASVAWSRHSRLLVGDMGTRLALVNPTDHAVRYALAPHDLPSQWPDIMQATYQGGDVSLRDTVTDQVFAEHAAAG